jgi:arylsulfatase A
MKNIIILLALLTSLNTMAEKQPNIIYLMLDEWGYFETSHMKNQYLLTPIIDQFASEGMQFTNAYAGAPVCGPTRASLLTGKHMGHASMRSNSGYAAIRADETTLGSMLKQKAYVTGGFGKWGIGARGTSGVPEKHGFDEFFGYYDQVHAHTYFPEYLIHNGKEVPLKGNSNQDRYKGETHAQDVIFKQSIKFIKDNKDKPFFCYLPWTPPHGHWGIKKDDPSWQIFKGKPWSAGQSKDTDAKVYAAFMHMVDRQIGEILTLLKELKIDDNTIFFLCGDNGGQPYFKNNAHPHGFFAPNLNPDNGERFRAGKGSLYEGGLKVPMYVRWPNKIKAGSVNDHMFYFPDIMPTLADIAKTETPETDGITILSTLLGHGKQKNHDYFYWEYLKQTALRMDQWKLYRKSAQSPWQLYDLSKDIEELNNIAKDHPQVLKQMIALTEEAHEDIRPGLIYDKELAFKDRPKHKKK